MKMKITRGPMKNCSIVLYMSIVMLLVGTFLFVPMVFLSYGFGMYCGMGLMFGSFIPLFISIILIGIRDEKKRRSYHRIRFLIDVLMRYNHYNPDFTGEVAKKYIRGD